MRKLFTLLLAVAASVGISANDFGTCGPDLRWTYNSQTHELVIGGSGPMYDYYSDYNVPWSPYREDITSVSFVEDNLIPLVAPTEGAVTLVWNIANIDEMCDEVGYVFAGNYNGWSSSVWDMAYFESIEGYPGWFKAVVPMNTVDHLEGKPCALQKDGTFNGYWDNQWIGTEYHPCEIISGSAELQIEYDVEARLVCAADADVVYIRSYAFKEDPCVDPVYENVTFNLTTTIPVTAGGTVYIVGDAFEQSWDPTAYPMTGSGSNWTITLPAIVGKEYKFVVNGNWANDQMKYDNDKACAEPIRQNFKVNWLTETPTVYGFMNFGVSEDQVCKEEVVEGEMWIKCAFNSWTWTKMTVDPDNNKVFTYEATVTDASIIGANIGVSNSSDGIWYDLGDMSAAAHGLAEGDAYKYIFTSTDGATGTLEVVPANNAPARKQKSESGTPTSSGITSIGAYAFYGCSNLTSIEIPNSVTSIGAGAFYGCSGLTSVIIPNSVTSIGNYAFSGCSGLTGELVIPNSVTSIGGGAFSGCSGLTSIEIPNSVTSIGNYAFQSCSGLTSVIIPNSVTGIGREAFYGCTGLTSMEAPAGFFDVINTENRWIYYTKILNHVIVNGGELTENALLFINRSYKTLQTLDVSGVTNTEFADEAFKGYYNLQQLVLPEGLQKVSYMMVAGCKNLQSIDIPASVEEIEQSAFEDCRSIQSITFGGAPAGAPGRFNAPAASASQLRRIGNWAFYNAHELQNLEIPEGVTEIGDGAFYGCTYIEEMVLPSSVQSIGDNCFALCAKLQKITCNAVTPPTIEAKTFFDVKRQIPVYVPDEAVSAYEDDTYWQEFDIQGQSEVPQGIEEISSSLQRGDRGRLILVNGQIFILRGDKTYTLTGAEVK